MEGKFDIVLSSDCRYQSLSIFFPFIESHENTILEFYFWYLSKWECKKYICGTLPFTALQVNPTMTTSAAEKPGNVKKVHKWIKNFYRYIAIDKISPIPNT